MKYSIRASLCIAKEAKQAKESRCSPCLPSPDWPPLCLNEDEMNLACLEQRPFRSIQARCWLVSMKQFGNLGII